MCNSIFKGYSPKSSKFFEPKNHGIEYLTQAHLSLHPYKDNSRNNYFDKNLVYIANATNCPLNLYAGHLGQACWNDANLLFCRCSPFYAYSFYSRRTIPCFSTYICCLSIFITYYLNLWIFIILKLVSIGLLKRDVLFLY